MRQSGERRENRVQQRIRRDGAFVFVTHQSDTLALRLPALMSATEKVSPYEWL